MIFNILLIALVVLVVASIVVGLIVCSKAMKGEPVGKRADSKRPLNKQPSSSINNSINVAKCGNSQDYLLFNEIDNFVVDMGGHQYRAAIEVSSINRSLKTPEENAMIDALYQRFLNSLRYPVRLYLQTREVDNSAMLDDLEHDIRENAMQFPALEEYGQRYQDGMANLSYYVGNRKQKKKFIIVPYDEAWKMDSLNDAEKKQFAYDELRTRIYTIKDGIESIGLTATVLNGAGLSEVVYASTHRDEYRIAEDIAKGEFSNLIVDGKNQLAELDANQMADVYLQQAINQFKSGILTQSTLPPEVRARYTRVIQILENLQIRIPDTTNSLDDIHAMSEEEAAVLLAMFENAAQQESKEDGERYEETNE